MFKYLGLGMCNKIIIYGAGMVGKLVAKVLTMEGLGDRIIGFAVSDGQISEKEIWGHQVYEISHLKHINNEAMVIIAAFPDKQEIMKNTLNDLGFFNFHEITLQEYNQLALYYMETKRGNFSQEEKIDIMYFSSDNNPTSGAFLCMVELARNVSALGAKPLIVLPEYGDGERVLEENGLKYIYIPMRNWTSRIRSYENTWNDEFMPNQDQALKVIESLIENCNVKLVHLNTTYSYLGAIAAKKKNIPIIWHIRENIREQGYWFNDAKFAYGLINQSSAIICVSNYVQSCYADLKKNIISIIYDGVSIDNFYFERKIFDREWEVSIVAVGAICELKGQIDLVKAVGILVEKGYKPLVRFVGSGDKDYLEKMYSMIRESRLENYISFEGTQLDIRMFYRNADVSVVCSRAEAFGRVTVEAQLSGCLVIGANKGATLELIEDYETGMIYESGNYYDLADKIEFAINNKDISRNMALKGQAYARHNFDQKRNTNKIIKLYGQLLMGE